MARLEPPVEQIPVESSFLSHLGYDPNSRTLAVRFSSGTLVHHHGVPPELHAAFVAAPSKGKFYGVAVRNKFEPVTQTGECPACGFGGLIGETCTDCGCREVEPKAPKARKVTS